MEASRLNRCTQIHKSRQAGFSMIEMLIATVILSVGLLSLAGLMSKMDLTTHDSRYMNAAALLCSEKLEELSGLPSSANSIRITGSNTSMGNLVSDSPTIDINGEKVSYSDQVSLSVSNGTISEVKKDADGKYSSIKQGPNGKLDAKDDLSTAPKADPGTITFKRRWLIENNVSGLPAQVRRITVRVEYPGQGGLPGKIQMSMVRNAQQ